jgi:hypothetical protein
MNSDFFLLLINNQTQTHNLLPHSLHGPTQCLGDFWQRSLILNQLSQLLSCSGSQDFPLVKTLAIQKPL